MSNIKLTYFPARGRAETSRLILAFAGKKYTDERIDFGEFGARKSSMPYGQVPLLEYDGVTICQSITITRFLATECGLAGKDNLENAKIDEVVDAVSDLLTARNGFVFESDAKLKEEKIAKFKNETAPNALKNLEATLTRRGGQYFSGRVTSWADLHFFAIMEHVMGAGVTLDKFPKLKNLMERTREIPNIKKWLAERPVTQL